MKKRFIAKTVLALALIQACTTSKEQKKVLEGKVKKETVSIAPKLAGRIEKIFVEEGQLVKSGDTLAILNVPEVDAKREQANGAVLAAKAQYQMALAGATSDERKQIEAMYNAANEQFAFAEKSFERLNKMFQDSLIAAQQYDEIFAKYMGAKAQLEAAEAKKNDVAKGVRSEKIKMAYGDLKRAEGALMEANIASTERYLVAPVDMTIETIALKQGELALPGYNIFIGYRPRSVYFRFTVAESRISRYKLNDHLQVKSPFDDNLEFKVKLVSVKQLNSYANKTSEFPGYKSGESIYELKLVPDDVNKASELFANSKMVMEEK